MARESCRSYTLLAPTVRDTLQASADLQPLDSPVLQSLDRFSMVFIGIAKHLQEWTLGSQRVMQLITAASVVPQVATFSVLAEQSSPPAVSISDAISSAPRLCCGAYLYKSSPPFQSTEDPSGIAGKVTWPPLHILQIYSTLQLSNNPQDRQRTVRLLCRVLGPTPRIPKTLEPL